MDGPHVGHFRDGAASAGSAATRACSRLVEARSTACFQQKQRIKNYTHETCVVSFRTQGTLQHAHFVHGVSSFAWNWSCTPEVRGATARGDRTPSARLLETPEIIHAHHGHWHDRTCTLCMRRALAQAPRTSPAGAAGV